MNETTPEEEARGLALRWAEGRRLMHESVRLDRLPVQVAKRAEVRLTDTERERLFAWVRGQVRDIRDRNVKAHMDHNVGPVSREFRRDIAATLEARLSEGPDRRTGDPMFGFENAWQLCEASGWPNG